MKYYRNRDIHRQSSSFRKSDELTVQNFRDIYHLKPCFANRLTNRANYPDNGRKVSRRFRIFPPKARPRIAREKFRVKYHFEHITVRLPCVCEQGSYVCRFYAVVLVKFANLSRRMRDSAIFMGEKSNLARFSQLKETLRVGIYVRSEKA